MTHHYPLLWEDVYVWGGRSGVGCPLVKTSDGRRRGWVGYISKLHNNKQRSLSPEWSLS